MLEAKGHQAALLTAALTRKAGATENVLGVGNYILLRSICSAAREAEALGRPRGGGEGRGHIVSPRAQLVDNVTAQVK